MAHPYNHALSSAKKHGGIWQDYIEIHNWFDESKKFHPDFRHRALRHHSEGIFMCEQIFGVVFYRESDGIPVRTRIIGEQHILEDLGKIPTFQDWIKNLPAVDWMFLRAAPIEEKIEK